MATTAESEAMSSNAHSSPPPKRPASPTSSDTSDNDLHYVRRLSDPGEVPYRSSPKSLYLLTLLSAVGGFLFGYDTGVVSGAMILVRPVSWWLEVGTLFNLLVSCISAETIKGIFCN